MRTSRPVNLVAAPRSGERPHPRKLYHSRRCSAQDPSADAQGEADVGIGAKVKDDVGSAIVCASVPASMVQSGPIADKRVRQALNYAIDRQRFAQTLMFGIVQPRSLPWLPNSPAYDASKENFYMMLLFD